MCRMSQLTHVDCLIGYQGWCAQVFMAAIRWDVRWGEVEVNGRSLVISYIMSIRLMIYTDTEYIYECI